MEMGWWDGDGMPLCQSGCARKLSTNTFCECERKENGKMVGKCNELQAQNCPLDVISRPPNVIHLSHQIDIEQTIKGQPKMFRVNVTLQQIFPWWCFPLLIEQSISSEDRMQKSWLSKTSEKFSDYLIIVTVILPQIPNQHPGEIPRNNFDMNWYCSAPLSPIVYFFFSVFLFC